MCKAIKYGTILTDTFSRMKEDYGKIKSKLSEYDKKVNELYHEIETSNLNASEGYKKYKELRQALRMRRVLKQEFYTLEKLLYKTFDIDRISNQIHKTVQNAKVSEVGNQQYRNGWDIELEVIIGQ
ncbi:hypothetical protein [Paenibacillus lactis]|uniref:hypothetical protein n=1 Tax=Paenibacillus lactis TaxID=228574 RepID=UPI003D73FEEC